MFVRAAVVLAAIPVDTRESLPDSSLLPINLRDARLFAAAGEIRSRTNIIAADRIELHSDNPFYKVSDSKVRSRIDRGSCCGSPTIGHPSTKCFTSFSVL